MWRAMAVVGALVVLGPGCGVRDDSEPRAIEADSVPFDLLAPSSTDAPDTATSPAETIASVYLVDGQGIIPVERAVPLPLTALGPLDALLDGATSEEAGEGLGSFIPIGTELLSVSGPTDGTLSLDLTEDFGNITGEGQRLALAQVVYTATALPGVERVSFSIEGVHRSVPAGSGEISNVPVGRSDYAEFLGGETG